MEKSTWAGVAVMGVISLVSGAAAAEPRTHDGFQFRAALGGGYLSDSETVTGPSDSLEGTVRGGAASFELYFGGSPIPGLTIGGFVSALSAPGPKVTLGGQEVNAADSTSLNLATIGPYLDFFPSPHGGFHVMGTVGFARVTASQDGNEVDSATSEGIGLGLGVGYDAWIADEWNLGILGRFTYAKTSHDVSGYTVDDNAIAPALLFSVSYQ